MTHTKKSAGKIFSLVFTAALICLMTVAIIPGVMGATAVNLGSAGNYAILAKTGISTTGTTSINGNIGVSPIVATAITGFGLSMDPSNQFSRSSLVNGGVYAANYAPPTPATMTTAVSAMEAAYTSAAGQAPPVAADMNAGNLGGKTLTPGVYKWSSGVLIPSGTDLTLDAQGNSGAVWVFQVAGDLTMGSASRMTLSNGASADNIFWQVAGPTSVTLGSGAHAEGNILSQKAIVMNSGASLNGRALAQTAVTLIANTITSPSPSSVPAQSSGGTGDPSYNGGTTTTQTLAPGETAAPTGTTTPTPTRTKAINTTISAIVSGDSVIYQANVTGTGISRLVVTGTVADGPGQGIGEAQGTVYQYINLEPSQHDTPIDQIEVSFSVPLSWMQNNNLSTQNVILNRLDGNAWRALPTTFVKTDGQNAYFTAITPEFSRLAITGQFTPSAALVPTAIPTQSPLIVYTETQLAPTLVPTTQSPLSVWLPAIAMVGALMIMAVFSGRKGKNS
jgi:PGF-pre-PGF domain-containing protein